MQDQSPVHSENPSNWLRLHYLDKYATDSEYYTIQRFNTKSIASVACRKGNEIKSPKWSRGYFTLSAAKVINAGNISSTKRWLDTKTSCCAMAGLMSIKKSNKTIQIL